MQSYLEDLPAPMTYTLILLQGQQDQGEILLQGTGLSEEDVCSGSYMTTRQQLQILTNVVHHSRQPEWGLQFGEKLNVSAHGPLGFAALSAKNLEQGLQVFADFVRCRAPYIDVAVTHSTDGYRLVIRQLVKRRELQVPLDEILVKIIHSHLLAVLGHSPPDLELHFAYAPPSYGHLYREYFQSAVHFDSDQTYVQLPLRYCGFPCPLYDPKTYRVSLARCREEVASVLDPRDAVARVRNLLAAHFDGVAQGRNQQPSPGLKDVADKLCVSPRTLIRQLDRQQSGFRVLLDEQQKASACKLLDQARFTVADVGEIMGYSDAANFSRAFQRWTGMAPGDYRRSK